MMPSTSKAATASYLAALAAAFLDEHDGYTLTVGEKHIEPRRYDEGRMILTVEITCPTGEPALTEAQYEAREAARAAAREAN